MKVCDYNMPTTNNEFKDGLRIQRDDWEEVIEYLAKSNVENNPEIEKAKNKATRVLKRINESLQD